MVSSFCLAPYWDHKPGGGMGGVGPPPAPRVNDLGGLLLELSVGDFLPFGLFITRTWGAEGHASFSVSISTFSQVTFRLQVACLRPPLSLSDHQTAEVSGIWGRSRVTAPACSILCRSAPCQVADPLCPCCVRRLGRNQLFQLLVGTPRNGCVLLVPPSCYVSTSVWRAFSARQLRVICTCGFANFVWQHWVFYTLGFLC